MLFVSVESSALYCSKKDFDLSDYQSYEMVEGVVVSVPKSSIELESAYKELKCKNADYCDFDDFDDFDELSRLYYLIEDSTKVLVVDSVGVNVDEGDVLKLYEANYPDLVVGERYLFFLRKSSVYDGYIHSPCSVIPLSIGADLDGYFFNQPPSKVYEIINRGRGLSGPS